jgi:alpha-mannosidase
MKYKSLTVLIPCHTIEDLPQELSEEHAEGLLNAFAVVWHPQLLDVSGVKPNWERADEPPEELQDRLFVIPAASEGWVPCQWIEHARSQGAIVVAGLAERFAMLEAALAPLSPRAVADADIVSDFFALGHCYLQLQRLTRQMRYFNELDETRLQTEAVSAARAALAADRQAAESHLRCCFEMLLEGRERFYPVDCYLADLCLLTPDMAIEAWSRCVHSDRTVNFLATAQDLESIAATHPDDFAAFCVRWQKGQQELIGGDWFETSTALLPLEASEASLQRGLAAVEKLCRRRPTVWGRRKYGVGVQVPQLLDKLGFQGALHFVMDDGVYPDEEQGKHRWEGCDGSIMDAVSRIPLAADSASALLRFPQRMAESMDYDHAALVVLAHWPRLHGPWLEDFHRIHRYAPVLGRFVTFSDFFQTTEIPGRLSRHKAGDYLSPHLVAAVARGESDPVSRYTDHWAQHHQLESAVWMSRMADVVEGRPIDAEHFSELETRIQLNDADPDSSRRRELQEMLEHSHREASATLAEVVVGAPGGIPGCFLANACSFGRRAVVFWPHDLPPPAESSPIVARNEEPDGLTLLVQLPPSGFVWLPVVDLPAQKESTRAALKPKARPVPMAEENVLRNEFFEVRLSDVTGGISQLKTYRRGPNRLSQQLAFRFPRELTLRTGEGDDTEQTQTWYTQMRVSSSRVVSDGPLRGEIETTGELVHPSDGAVIAGFQEIVRVWRGIPIVELDVTLDVQRLPEGNPWSNYYAVRWAWSDSAAALTCSVQEGAHSVTAERFEALHYIEIVEDEYRTTIHTLGLPFHRKTGPRMLDTLLVPAGESRRQYRFVISVDEPYPMEWSRACLQEVHPVVVSNGRNLPASGWFFHLDTRNVQITRIMPLPEGLRGGVMRSTPSAESPRTAAGEQGAGFRVRLRETEGRGRTVRLRCFRSPAFARQCNSLGEAITDLTIDGDAIVVEVTPYEICDVVVHFTE